MQLEISMGDKNIFHTYFKYIYKTKTKMEQIFKPGEEVIALTSNPDDKCQKRIKGNKYNVQVVSYCSRCGQQSINIGQSTKKNTITYVECDCGNLQKSNGLYWTESKQFIKPEECLTYALEEEDYDLAIKIRDIK